MNLKGNGKKEMNIRKKDKKKKQSKGYETHPWETEGEKKASQGTITGQNSQKIHH